MIVSCAVFFAFFFGMVFTVKSCSNDSIKKKFMDMLSEEQKEKYEKIIEERRDIYSKGYVIGLTVAILLTMNMKSSMNRMCVGGAISLTINYFYYILHKKSDYMVLHLDNKEKRVEWLKIYKTMQQRYHLGLLFGILSVLALESKL